MAIVIVESGGGGGGYISYSDARDAGATPAGVFVDDDPRIIPYLGFNNGSYSSSSTARLPPIPLEWVIAPLNVTAGQCPTAEQTKLAFGITNAVVAVLTLVFGCRPILHYLSRGWLGKKGGKGVLWTWIISFALQLLSNVLPLTYAVNGLRDVMIKGGDLTWSSLQLDVGVVLGFVFLVLVAGVATLRRRIA